MTLNHDTLVEQILAQNGIDFVDGFGPSDGDIRWHDDSTYDRDDARIRVIKLHGSVDWYAFLREGLPWHAIASGNDPLQSRNRDGQKLNLYQKTPSFLAGANKIVHYNRGIFSDMFYRFHQALRKHRTVIMSGYGWGDTGVNMKFDYWLDYNIENRLVLLHQSPETLLDRSLLLASGHDSWTKKGQLISIRKWLSCTTMDELQAVLGL